MPFTLAHPAAILPLCYRPYRPGIMSALIIGSMAPDFVYWLPLSLYRDHSHTLPALFWFCLPAGLFVFGLYHTLLKRPLVALLPRAITIRLWPLPPMQWRLRDVIPVMLAVLFGAFTHIAWDAFTHYDTPITRRLPFLEAPLLTQGGYVLRVYKALQHGSTLVGMGILTLCGWRWYQRTPPRDDVAPEVLSARGKVALAACLTLPSVLGAIRSGLLNAPWEASLKALQTFLMSGVVAGMGVFGAALLTLGLLWPLVERRET